MSATTLIAVLAGTAIPAGLALALLGLVPGAARPSRVRTSMLRRVGRALAGEDGRTARRRRLVAMVSVVAGAVLWLLSGWVVAVVVVPLAALGLPVLLGRAGNGDQVDRLEALEEWTRHLSGVLDVGVGLEQAIAVNLRSTPEAIRPQVQTLVARLRARWRTEQALRAFAADLDDATGDLVAASLILGAQRRGSGLTRVLTGLAETVADEVRMRRQVEADRAKPRTTARAVTLITLAVLALLTLNGTYIAPYGEPVGQMVLAVLLGAYVGALLWMRAMTRARPAPRLLTGTGVAAPATAPAPTPAVS